VWPRDYFSDWFVDGYWQNEPSSDIDGQWWPTDYWPDGYWPANAAAGPAVVTVTPSGGAVCGGSAGIERVGGAEGVSAGIRRIFIFYPTVRTVRAFGGCVCGGSAGVETGRSARVIRKQRDERDLLMLRLAA
jgi:hypothetical protein